MSIVVEVKKADIFKSETKVSNPWLDPKFNKVDDLGGEPGFKVDDIPERLGLVQQGFNPASPAYYFTDLEDTPRNYGTKLQFIQTDGKGKLSWAWPFWSKAGSTVYYKSGKVAIGHAAARTVLHVLTPTASEVRIEVSGASDPTLSFKTTNTAHQVNFYLDESATNDNFYIEGKTAGVNTSVHIIAVDGKVAGLNLYSGATNYGALTFSASDNLNLKNSVQDKDLIFGIKDGAVNKTITWDADVDQLKHSAGLFDFDDDNLLTTGTLGAGNATLGTIGCGTITVVNGSSINLQEDITFTGATAQNLIKFPDNLVTALSFREGANAYLTFKTTNAAEAVIFGKIFTGVTGSTIGNLTLANGSITDSSGAISFGNENLTTTGWLSVGSTPALSGAIRLPSNTAIKWRKADNSADVTVFELDGSNVAILGWNINCNIGRGATTFIGADGGGGLFINETTNTKMATGLTINQGAADNEILTLKSSDVAHGITTQTETNTYGLMGKIGGTGGLLIRGFHDGVYGLFLSGVCTADNTSKDTTALAPTWVLSGKKSGTSGGDVGADGNLFVVWNWSAGCKFIVDEDGDILYDGGASSYQEYDDIALLAELEDVLSDKFSKREMKRKDIYKKHKVVHVSEGLDEEGEPFFSRFVSTKKKNMLLYGAIRQLNERVKELGAQIGV